MEYTCPPSLTFSEEKKRHLKAAQNPEDGFTISKTTEFEPRKAANPQPSLRCFEGTGWGCGEVAQTGLSSPQSKTCKAEKQRCDLRGRESPLRAGLSRLEFNCIFADNVPPLRPQRSAPRYNVPATHTDPAPARTVPGRPGGSSAPPSHKIAGSGNFLSPGRRGAGPACPSRRGPGLQGARPTKGGPAGGSRFRRRSRREPAARAPRSGRGPLPPSLAAGAAGPPAMNGARPPRRPPRRALTPALGGAPQELSAGRVVDEPLPLGQALVEGLLLSLRHGGRAGGEGNEGRGAAGDEGLGGASWRRRRRSPATAAEDGAAADDSPLRDH